MQCREHRRKYCDICKAKVDRAVASGQSASEAEKLMWITVLASAADSNASCDTSSSSYDTAPSYDTSSSSSSDSGGYSASYDSGC